MAQHQLGFSTIQQTTSKLELFPAAVTHPSNLLTPQKMLLPSVAHTHWNYCPDACEVCCQTLLCVSSLGAAKIAAQELFSGEESASQQLELDSCSLALPKHQPETALCDLSAVLRLAHAADQTEAHPATSGYFAAGVVCP